MHVLLFSTGTGSHRCSFFDERTFLYSCLDRNSGFSRDGIGKPYEEDVSALLEEFLHVLPLYFRRQILHEDCLRDVGGVVLVVTKISLRFL